MNKEQQVINLNQFLQGVQSPLNQDIPVEKHYFVYPNVEEKRNICFVIGDDEILFNKSLLSDYSPYIKNLVQNLDATKNVRILLPKWIKKTAFIKYLKYIQSQEHQDQPSLNESGLKQRSKSPTKNEIEHANQDIVWNLLQISDFFQTKIVLDDCIKHLKVSRENCYLFIQESLKKIESSQRTNNGYARDSWFSLTQKCITVASQTLTSQRELDQLKDLSSKYLQKEILERFIKNQISNVNGIDKQEIFSKSLSLLQEARNCENYDLLAFFDREYKERLNTVNQKKKAYINWAVQLNPSVTSYQSDIVRIDELSWKFQVQIDESTNTFNIYIKNIGNNLTSTINTHNESTSSRHAPTYMSSVMRKLSSSPTNNSMINKTTKPGLTINSQNSLNKTSNNISSGLSSSYLYSMNRIANKQRQPNQNSRQKSVGQPTTPQVQEGGSMRFIQKNQDKIKRNNLSQGLTSQRSEQQSNSMVRASHNTSINQQTIIHTDSQSRNLNNNHAYQSKKCNSIHDEGFPIVAQVEVQLQQSSPSKSVRQTQASSYTSFVNSVQKPYLIGQIQPTTPIDFTQPYFFKIIFKIDFPLTSFLFNASSKMETLYESSSVQMLNQENFKALLFSHSLNLEHPDHFLQIILSWTGINKGQISEFRQLINWQLISQEYLIYLYQNQYLLDQTILQDVKQELLDRNLLNENFEALLQEKFKEITELKGELEKYKMSEKLATSIVESPYNYNSAQQAIRKRKREGSNVGNISNMTQEIFGDILDSSYTSHQSNISFPGHNSALSNIVGTAEKPSFIISEAKFSSEKALDSIPSTPHTNEKSLRGIGVIDRSGGSQRNKQVAINLENLVKQMSQASDTSSAQLDKLLDESQKIIMDTKFSHQSSISEKRSSSAASQLKDILYQTPNAISLTTGKVTAATTKQPTMHHTRATSQSNQLSKQPMFHSKQPSHGYQPIAQPRIMGNDNLDNLNLADIKYQHPTSQKHQNLMPKPQGSFQFGGLNNTQQLGQSHLQRFRQQNTYNAQANQSQPIQVQQHLNTSSSAGPQKKQPRFIIKKPKQQ